MTVSNLVPQLNTSSDQLVTHRLRPQWGAAILVKEEKSKRSYQFRDGVLRKLKRGFYDMMVPLEASEAREAILLDELERLHEHTRDERTQREQIQAQPPVMSLDDQLRVFHHLYPEGFQDPAYLAAWRRPTGSRPAKRHVDAALELASTLLAAERLEGLLAAGDYVHVLGSLLRVLKHTSLANPTRVVSPLADAGTEHDEALARALVTLLHGEGTHRRRFEGWLLALGEVEGLEVSWPMATLPCALVHPARHVCVKHNVFQQQARIVSAAAVTRKRPTPLGYERMSAVARATHNALVEAGLKPADLLDVRSFIWETLRPSGQDTLAELRGRQVR